jgi:predicted outer membrane protein
MSYTVDTATEIYDRQVAAVSAVQSLLVQAVGTLSELADKAPKVPEKLSSTLDDVAGPLTEIVGTPSEVQAYAVARSRDWLEVQHKFQTALLDAVSRSGVTVEAPKATTAKTS